MQTQCPHCKSRYRLSPEMIEAFGGFVRCGNCDYKFNVHDQVQVERDYFELSSADKLDEDAPVRLHTMGGIDDEEITAPPSGKIEPALEVQDDGLNIRFTADEFGQQVPVADSPSKRKVEPLLEGTAGAEAPEEASVPELRIDVDNEIAPDSGNVLFSQQDDAENESSLSLADTALSEAPESPETGLQITEPESEQRLASVAKNTDVSVPDTEGSSNPQSGADADGIDDAELDGLDELLHLSENADEKSGSLLSDANTDPGPPLDDFNWGADSDAQLQDSKPTHVFDDAEEGAATPESADPLEAFTFSREEDAERFEDGAEGEVHTLINDDEEQQLADAPGFVRRFVTGFGRFVVFGFWLLLSVGLVYLLIGQFRDRVYPQIKSEPLVQDIRSRLCSFLPCTVSKYDADKYEIVVSRMDEVRDPNRQLHISVFLLNRADQAQVYPSLRITFKRLDGSVVGQRRIDPSEYSTSSDRVIMAGDGAGGVTKPLIKPNKLGKVLIRFNNPPLDAVGFEAQVAP